MWFINHVIHQLDSVNVVCYSRTLFAFCLFLYVTSSPSCDIARSRLPAASAGASRTCSVLPGASLFQGATRPLQEEEARCPREPGGTSAILREAGGTQAASREAGPPAPLRVCAWPQRLWASPRHCPCPLWPQGFGPSLVWRLLLPLSSRPPLQHNLLLSACDPLWFPGLICIFPKLHWYYCNILWFVKWKTSS